MKLLNKEERRAYAVRHPYVEEATSEKGKDRWIKYFCNEHIIKTDSGHYITISKPSIDSTIYYSDVNPDPLKEATDKEEFFINHNVDYNFKDFGISRWLEESEALEKRGCCSGIRRDKPCLWIDDRGNVIVSFLNTDWDRDEWYINSGYTKHEMSTGEIQQMVDIMAELKQMYVKRLKTYYKRYGHKISSYGYWADR